MKREQYKIDNSNNNSETVYVFFSLHELKKAIKGGRDTAPGRDGLVYNVF